MFAGRPLAELIRPPQGRIDYLTLSATPRFPVTTVTSKQVPASAQWKSYGRIVIDGTPL
jgi:hypothetical protein